MYVPANHSSFIFIVTYIFQSLDVISNANHQKYMKQTMTKISQISDFQRFAVERSIF